MLKKKTKRNGLKDIEKKIIIKGERKIDDLNILCGLCNWANYFNKKFAMKYDVKLKE
jgi:hypothetical protein